MKLIIREYVTSAGRDPFREWLDTLAASVKARIQARVLRFEIGNLGDHKTVGGGVWEARLMFGPGYRIYFGKASRTTIVLLLGGDKESQSKNIHRARSYWSDYLEVTQHGKTQ
jgi:putative addiction module killer protein